MLVHRHMRLEYEVVKWIALLLIATGLVLVIARPLSGSAVVPANTTEVSADDSPLSVMNDQGESKLIKIIVRP